MKELNDNILIDIKKIIWKRIDLNKYKIFLFWSRAIWTAKYNSDYDIGIEWKNKVNFDDFLMIKSDMYDIPANIDIVDFQTTSEQFKKIAKKKIILL